MRKHRKRLTRGEMFFKTEFDHAKYKTNLKLPRADKHFIIFFTARSGSSWLTDIAVQTGRLSRPGECFNPDFLPGIAAKYNAATMPQYMEMLLRKRNTNGVFGCQIEMPQIEQVFGSIGVFLQYFTRPKCIFLIREDIVAQAVSLTKKKQLGVGHSVQLQGDFRRLDNNFRYDNQQIKKRVLHLSRAEQEFEAAFARFGIEPLRMSYERNIAAGAEAVLQRVADFVGIADFEASNVKAAHEKLGTPKNEEFADMFRERNPRLIAQIDTGRQELLSRLRRIQ